MRAQCELKSETDHREGRQVFSNTRRTKLRRIVSTLVILGFAAALCSPAMLFGQNQKSTKKIKVKEKKDPQADVGASSMLPENQAIDLMVSQMLGAWQAGDAEGMHKFYADDVMVVSGAWEPPLFGWANYVKAYQAQFARTSGCRLERSNSYIKANGDTAVVAYQWQFVGDVDGRRTQALGHSTLVLEKRAGNWLITVNHTSAIPNDDLSTQTSTPAAGQPTSSLAPAAR
jgi:uncharacterized protein (TIGR02246 family)